MKSLLGMIYVTVSICALLATPPQKVTEARGGAAKKAAPTPSVQFLPPAARTITIMKRPDAAAFPRPSHKVKVIALEKHTLPTVGNCSCSQGTRRDVMSLVVDFDPPIPAKQHFWFIMEMDGGGKTLVGMGQLFGNHGITAPCNSQKLMVGETVGPDGKVSGSDLGYALRDLADAERRVKFIRAGKQPDYSPDDNPGPSKWIWTVDVDAPINTLSIIFSSSAPGPILKSLSIDGKSVQIPK